MLAARLILNGSPPAQPLLRREQQGWAKVGGSRSGVGAGPGCLVGRRCPWTSSQGQVGVCYRVVGRTRGS